jgi:hypothetical protein
MSYLPDKLGTIGIAIRGVSGGVDSVAEMLPTVLREKVEQKIGRCTT